MRRIDWIFSSVKEWAFRKKNPFFVAARILLPPVLVGLSADIAIKISDGDQKFSVRLFDSFPSLVEYILWLMLVLFIALVLGGVRYDKKKDDRTHHMLIQHTGMVVENCAPLRDSYPYSKHAKHIETHADFKDGMQQNPEEALRKVCNGIESRLDDLAGLNKSDVNFAYGGICPVPFAYTSGFLIGRGGTTSFEVWDYQRTRGKWHNLDAPSQGLDVQVQDADNDKSKQAVLVLEFSYTASLQDLPDHLKALPLTKLFISPTRIDAVVSRADLQILQDKFLDVLNQLQARGVERIHLISVTQMSTCAMLGAMLNKNHPPVFVYQYERSNPESKYPWAVELEFSKTPRIVRG